MPEVAPAGMKHTEGVEHTRQGPDPPESARSPSMYLQDAAVSWHSTFVTHRVSRMMGTPHTHCFVAASHPNCMTLSLVEGHSAHLTRSSLRGLSKHVSPCVHERVRGRHKISCTSTSTASAIRR